MIIKKGKIAQRDIDLSKLLILHDITDSHLGDELFHNESFALVEIVPQSSTQNEIKYTMCDMHHSTENGAIMYGIIRLITSTYPHNKTIYTLKGKDLDKIKPLTFGQILHISQMVRYW